MTIRFQAPILPPVTAVARYFAESEAVRWYSNGGPCHDALVTRLEHRLDAHCVPTASGTLALMVGLRALTAERAPGVDRILMPSYTFAAVAEAALWAGLEPVFVDVDRDTWHLDATELERGLDEYGPSVAAVLACSTFGSPPPPAQSAAWQRLAQKAEAGLLVDSAAGFGATATAGQPLGHQGDAEVFSFHATKPFAIGEGGVVVTDDQGLAEHLRRLTNFGFAHGSVDGSVGLNAKLPEWSAATALAVLDSFDGVLAARRQRAQEITQRLLPHGFVEQTGEGDRAWQFVPLLVPESADADAVVAAAEDDGIELRRYFSTPLHRMRAFAHFPVVGDLHETERLARRAVSLPMANDLTAADLDAIVDSVAGAVRVQA